MRPLSSAPGLRIMLIKYLGFGFDDARTAFASPYMGVGLLESRRRLISIRAFADYDRDGVPSTLGPANEPFGFSGASALLSEKLRLHFLLGCALGRLGGRIASCCMPDRWIYENCLYVCMEFFDVMRWICIFLNKFLSFYIRAHASKFCLCIGVLFQFWHILIFHLVFLYLQMGFESLVSIAYLRYSIFSFVLDFLGASRSRASVKGNSARNAKVGTKFRTSV